MKKFIALYIFITAAQYSIGQNWEWSNSLSSLGDVKPLDLEIDNNDNIYLAGRFDDQSLSIGSEAITNHGGRDGFICKFNPEGTLQWIQSIGGSGTDLAVTIEIIDNNLFVGGNFDSPILYFSPTESLTNENSFDSYLAQYDLNGNIINVNRIFSGTNQQRIIDMLHDPSTNNLIILGYFQNQIKYNDESSTQTITARGSKDLYIFRSDLTGIILDTVTAYSTGNSAFKSINLSLNEGFYIGADLSGSMYFSPGGSIQGNSATTTDALIIKVDKELDFQWARKGGGTGYDHVNSSVNDRYGNLYIAGKCESLVRFDSTELIQSSAINSFGAQDLYIAKYNKLGRLLWIKRKGDAGEDDAYGLTQRENLVQFCGNTSGQVIFNEDTLLTSSILDVNTGFAILNLEGNEIGAQGIGGVGTDRGELIAFSANGNTLISGFFNSSSLTIGDSTYSNISGFNNGFIASYYYPLNAVFTSVKNLECAGVSDGELIVTPYFGSAPYTYEWSSNVTDYNDSLAFNLSGGTYSVTVTDSRDSVATSTIILYEPPAIIIASTQTNINCYPTDGIGNNGSVNLTITGGTGDHIFNWEAISGSGVNATAQDQTTLAAGTYGVVVIDENLCTTSDTFYINQPDQIVFGATIITDETIPPGSNGEIGLTVTGGTNPYSYQWSSPSGYSSTIEDINTLIGDSYTVLVTDAKSCSSDTTFLVANNVLLIAYISDKTDVDCNGNNTGSATVALINGTGPYTYHWENNLGATVDGNSPIVINLPADLYFVTVTDEFTSNTANTSVQIVEPSQALAANVIIGSEISCFGDINGVADLTVTGGTLPYNFLWSDNSTEEDLLNIGTGTYSVTVTDDNGCADNDEITLSEPAALDIFITTEQPIMCNGDASGRVTALATGGTGLKTYVWDDPGNQTAATATSLLAGTYHVTATDLNECTIVGQVQLIEPVILTLSETHQNALCNAENDGIINLTVNGGTPVFNYDWSNGQITQDISNLDTGNYSVIVTDAHNCTAQLSVDILQPDEVIFQNIQITNASCSGLSDGEVVITATGGTGAFQYSTNGGIDYQVNSTFSNIAAGDYVLKIIDDNDCESADSSVSITEPEGTTLTSTDITDVTCNSYADGGLIISASNPLGSLTYSIDNGSSYIDNNGVFSNLEAGIYPLWIRDGNGCEQQFSDITVAEPEAVLPDTNVQHAVGDQNGEVLITAAGGTSPYSYTLFSDTYDSTNTTGQFNELIPDGYFAFVTDNNLCTSDTLEISILQSSTQLIIYDAFSPNNDGRNDSWNIGNISLYPNCTVTVFNTWGNTVFSSKGYAEPWDGKYKDKFLPAGTYYYIIDLGDSSPSLSGPVSIVR